MAAPWPPAASPWPRRGPACPGCDPAASSSRSADKQTSKAIKELLQSGGGFVDKAVVFRIDGDKRDDAVVRVHSGGAAGVVAVYVFDRQPQERQAGAIFRSQSLMRASTRVLKGVIPHVALQPGRRDLLPRPPHPVDARLDADERRIDGRRAARRL